MGRKVLVAQFVTESNANSAKALGMRMARVWASGTCSPTGIR